MRRNGYSKEPKITDEERKQANNIRRLIDMVGERLAPDSVRNNEHMKAQLEAMGFKGTMNESIVARLYLIALRGKFTEAIQATRLIMEINDNKKMKGGKNFIINFISPSQEVGEEPKTTDLTSDSWSIVQGEGKSDTPIKSDTP